jgi:hypothetical protein
MAMKKDNKNTPDIEHDADCLQHLDEVLQAEEQAHTEYLD